MKSYKFDGKLYITEEAMIAAKANFNTETTSKKNVTLEEWFLNKEFTQSEIHVIKSSDTLILKETEKAVQIKFSSKFGNITKWIPKTIIN